MKQVETVSYRVLVKKRAKAGHGRDHGKIKKHKKRTKRVVRSRAPHVRG